MCRWLIYSGEKTDLKSILWTPTNSIFKQSFKKQYTPFVTKLNKRDHPINVDGFGIVWYDLKKNHVYLYKNNQTPWSDQNILNLSEFIKSKLIFSHIRAIKPFSQNSIVNYQNCHPFYYRNFTWMHNGDIKSVIKLQKYVYLHCQDTIIQNIKGNTDSEYLFAILLHQLSQISPFQKKFSLKALKQAFLKTIQITLELVQHEICSLNIAFTDGKNIICSRFINTSKESPPSLYYSFINRESNKKNIIISSEPINTESQDWKLIPKNHFLIYTSKKNKKIHKISYKRDT